MPGEQFHKARRRTKDQLMFTFVRSFRLVRSREALTAVALMFLSGASFAAERCEMHVAPGYDAGVGVNDEQWIVAGSGDECSFQPIKFASSACRLEQDFQHGARYFLCGNLYGFWGDRRPDDLYLAAAIEAAKARGITLLQYDQLRKEWLAPIDTEGWNGGMEADEELIVGLYPRRFTYIGAKTSSENPDFSATSQALRYVTVNGESRAAVTGEAAIGCLRIYFVSWVPAESSDTAEREMKTLLRDLRLGGKMTLDDNDLQSAGYTVTWPEYREQICKRLF
jgi:hypothetical protein